MPDLEWVRDGEDLAYTLLSGFQAGLGIDATSGQEHVVARFESQRMSGLPLPTWLQLAMTSAQARRVAEMLIGQANALDRMTELDRTRPRNPE